uniref:Transposase n=1 Tax=Gongylonema pulchrum TaxID=637853 RepID=A0A183DJY4_9BILA
LHVLVTAIGFSQEHCARKLANGVRCIKALLANPNDEYKRRQLVQLAIINGTYRYRGT